MYQSRGSEATAPTLTSVLLPVAVTDISQKPKEIKQNKESGGAEGQEGPRGRRGPSVENVCLACLIAARFLFDTTINS